MKILLHYNRRNLTGKAPIEYQIAFSRTDRVFISTKILIEPEFWDFSNKEVKAKHKESMSFNMQIKALRDRLYEIEAMYQAKGETLTSSLLKIELTNKPPSTTFNEYFSKQLEIDRPALQDSTYRRLKSVLKNLNEFRKVTFMQCNTAFIREYHNHLLKTMLQTTTPKNHKTLSKYMKRAVNDGFLKQNPYLNFKIPAYANRTVYLTTEELMKIRNKDFGNDRLNIVRDYFLFMCNTGLEFSDLMGLKHDDIAAVNENMFIIKNRIKVTSETYAIPLLPEAVEIIKKYPEELENKGFIFPRRSNQKINSYLKEIADICLINKQLTTITARHTYATIMLTKGLPLETVSHILGHSNVKTTKIYAKLITSKITNDLNRLNITNI